MSTNDRVSSLKVPHPLRLPISQSSLWNSWISFSLFLLPFLSFHILLYLQWDHNPQFLQRYCNLRGNIMI